LCFSAKFSIRSDPRAEPASPHMLRHSFASRLRENGADLQDIQAALAHAVITTTTMYAHLTTRRQREKLTEYLK
jgi:site-specific recombinase XerD